MGKRWANPDYLAELAEAGAVPELLKMPSTWTQSAMTWPKPWTRP